MECLPKQTESLSHEVSQARVTWSVLGALQLSERRVSQTSFCIFTACGMNGINQRVTTQGLNIPFDTVDVFTGLPFWNQKEQGARTLRSVPWRSIDGGVKLRVETEQLRPD